MACIHRRIDHANLYGVLVKSSGMDDNIIKCKGS